MRFFYAHNDYYYNFGVFCCCCGILVVDSFSTDVDTYIEYICRWVGVYVCIDSENILWAAAFEKIHDIYCSSPSRSWQLLEYYGIIS